MITPDTRPPPPAPNLPPPKGSFEAFDWAGRLSIEMVREHTKTDDTPGVSDEMLRLYRQASIEAAEFYTGMLLKGKKTLVEGGAGGDGPTKHEQRGLGPRVRASRRSDDTRDRTR